MLPSVRGRLDRLRQQYAPHERRPLDGYLVTLSAFGALAAALAVTVKGSGRAVPVRPAAADIVLISLATHKLSRMIAKESVTSPLRAPFTRYRAASGSAELAEEVRDEGSSVRHSVGELITCPFCLAVWVATGLTGGLVLAPRLTRLTATVFTATAASDFLQMAYAIAKNAAESPPTPPSPDVWHGSQRVPEWEAGADR